MKTIIFDIDGTITDMWPIEKSVLLSMLGKNNRTAIEKIYNSGIKDTFNIFKNISQSKIGKNKYFEIYNKKFSFLKRKNKLPKPIGYPIVKWIKMNKVRYNFIYATGGQAKETEYILRCLKIIEFFDINQSLNKNNYRFSKISGLPFKKTQNYRLKPIG